jgi:hypothetical protein
MSIAVPQWPMLKEVLRHQELMDDMMERCGVDVPDLIRKDGGQSFAEARTRCRLCLCEKGCREWLLLAGNDPCSPPDFCPNAPLFRACLNKES